LTWIDIPSRQLQFAFGFSRRSCQLIVLCLGLLQAASALKAEEAPIEGRAEFQLFRNSMRDIVTRCIYRVTERDVLVGALKALKHDLGAKFSATLPSDLERKSPEETWLVYQGTLLQLAHSSENKQSLKNLVELSLRSYCQTVDRYSAYDDYDTWRKLQEFGEPDYTGVGITVIEGREEDFICDPIRGGPADRAGIDEGDRLVAVNERSVRGATRLQIRMWLGETQENSVQLRVRHRSGQEETVGVPKEQIQYTPVSMEENDSGVQIALHQLSARGVNDLRNLLRSIGPARAITLDLRGCGGGPVQFAVSVASMFLPANTVIGKLETLTGTETLLSNNSAPYKPAKVSILQDRLTASGAELIIVALRSYKPLKAESYGEKTYGKGVTQDVVKVSGANRAGETVVEPGILTITDSRIYGPDGEFWDNDGLPPSRGDNPIK
jgi:carboxyl-terminal processing protease